MSVSTEVQRTLVKSPPELWAELGSADGLTRHLGEIGEIRVTKVEPESMVEWEADRASGIVELEQSGWGTKVRLSLTRELPEVEDPGDSAPKAATNPDAVAEPDAVVKLDAEAESTAADPKARGEPVGEPAVEPEPAGGAPASEARPEPAVDSRPEPAAVEPQPEPQPAIEGQSEPAVAKLQPEPQPAAKGQSEPAAVEPEPVAAAPQPKPENQPVATEPAPRQGFFARLFKRRQPPPVAVKPEPEPKPQPVVEAEPKPQPVVEAEPMVELKALAASEPFIEPRALALPEPIYPDPPPPKSVEPTEPAQDLTTELAELETQMQQESTELLTGVLDRLGAAHHRPFSRG